MAKRPPLQIKPRNDSSFGKWIFILVLCGAAVGAYVKRDVVMQKVHDLVHGAPPTEEALPPGALVAVPLTPTAAAPAASTTANPCLAYTNNPAQYAACQDREQKIKRMKEDAKARDKAFEHVPTKDSPQPATNTTGH